MELLEKVNEVGYPGMLVFAQIIKNIDYNNRTGQDSYEYYDKLKAGFIMSESERFENYYVVKFFTGEKAYHWGADLFYRKEKKKLDRPREI